MSFLNLFSKVFKIFNNILIIVNLSIYIVRLQPPTHTGGDSCNIVHYFSFSFPFNSFSFFFVPFLNLGLTITAGAGGQLCSRSYGEGGGGVIINGDGVRQNDGRSLGYGSGGGLTGESILSMFDSKVAIMLDLQICVSVTQSNKRTVNCKKFQTMLFSGHWSENFYTDQLSTFSTSF